MQVSFVHIRNAGFFIHVRNAGLFYSYKASFFDISVFHAKSYNKLKKKLYYREFHRFCCRFIYKHNGKHLYFMSLVAKKAPQDR